MLFQEDEIKRKLLLQRLLCEGDGHLETIAVDEILSTSLTHHDETFPIIVTYLSMYLIQSGDYHRIIGHHHLLIIIKDHLSAIF